MCERCALLVQILAPSTAQPPVDAAGAGADRGEVGAGIGLAHADAEIAFAARDLRQIGALLRLGAEAQDERAGLAVGDPMRARRRARRQHLLGHDIAFERRPAAPAIALRPGHADPAARTHGAAELGRELAPAAQARLERAGATLLVEEATDVGAQPLRLGRKAGRLEVEPGDAHGVRVIVPLPVAAGGRLRSRR